MRQSSKSVWRENRLTQHTKRKHSINIIEFCYYCTLQKIFIAYNSTYEMSKNVHDKRKTKNKMAKYEII